MLLMADGMDEDEAREYLEFNIAGAYVGVETPVIVWPASVEELHEMADALADD